MQCRRLGLCTTRAAARLVCRRRTEKVNGAHRGRVAGGEMELGAGAHAALEEANLVDARNAGADRRHNAGRGDEAALDELREDKET